MGVFGLFCYVMALQMGKCLKRPFPVILAKKVTSMTPLKIGFHIGIVESVSKIQHFLLSELEIPRKSDPL